VGPGDGDGEAALGAGVRVGWEAGAGDGVTGPQAASPAATDPAAMPRRNKRREIGRGVAIAANHSPSRVLGSRGGLQGARGGLRGPGAARPRGPRRQAGYRSALNVSQAAGSPDS
jgi:hypothetical protein